MLKQGLTYTWGGNRDLDVESLNDKRNLNLEKPHCTGGWSMPGLQHSQG